jgi:cell fate (sporulation/competence/biofilm development) regulator YmcA (YheA/YmcA/DUF963 family)
MEAQTLVDIVVAFIGVLGGWALNSLSKSIIRIEDKIAEMPLLYVTRDDYREDISEVKAMLSRIWDKLENKVDK